MRTKQVIILRKDLNMRKGKMCAQAAHASMGVFTKTAKTFHIFMFIKLTKASLSWFKQSFVKVVVGVDSEEELLNLYASAKVKKLPCSLIKDAGKTEFKGRRTHTAVAIGPAESHLVDEITGRLKLL